MKPTKRLELNNPHYVLLLTERISALLVSKSRDLMKSLQENSRRRRYEYQTSGTVEYDEFYPNKSKQIIDEIDKVLAKHYGFTEEELDFIIN